MTSPHRRQATMAQRHQPAFVWPPAAAL